MIQVGDNFDHKSKKPLDARTSYATLALMKAVVDANIYEGCEAYCVETDKYYMFKSTNTVDVDTGKWRERQSGGSGTDDYADLDNKPQVNGVTLSGNKTSADLKLQSEMQVTSLPTAGIDYLGKVYQYVGATGSGLTHNYYYECVSDGQSTPTYSWEQTDVQPHGETYTAGDGINIDANKEISIDPMPSEDMDEIIDELPTGNRVAVTGYVPLGTIIPVFRETAPKFFLICDGSAYNKADYPELAELLLGLTTHSQYEVDGDDTKFKVPDLRGEFIRGTGTNSHENQGSGADVGLHQDATENLWITRYRDAINPDNNLLVNSDVAKNDPSSNLQPRNQDSNIAGRLAYHNIKITSSTVDSSQSVSRYTVRPTNTSVLFCIAYKDIYSNPMNDYSTDEKVVGTWIDGKTLYQRTHVIDLSTFATIDTTRQYVNLLTVNTAIDVVFIVNGYHYDSNCFNPIVEPVGDSVYSLIRVNKGTGNYMIQGLSEGTNWLRQSINNKSGNVVLTMQYTKA